MARSKTHERRVAEQCVTEARAMLGVGWSHVSDDVRWGLVSARVLAVIVGQHYIDDESATAEQKASIADYALCLWREASAIRDAGWRA